LMPLSSISVVLFACGAANWAARGMKKIIKPEGRNPTGTPKPKADPVGDANFGIAQTFHVASLT
jgi:hypothetical protein